MVIGFIVVSLIALGLGAGVLFLTMRVNALARPLEEARAQLALLSTEREALRANNAALAKQMQDAAAEDQKKISWLDHQEREITWLRSELEKRPKVTRKTYKVLTLGVKWTGKT